MAEWPFISIVVPVFNGGHTIDASLQSLLALNYPKDRYEIIVVDNNSKDNTVERVEQYPVTLLHEKTVQSSYAARNRGIEVAKGEIIAFTDSACVAHPDWLKHLIDDYKNLNWGGFAGGLEAYQPSTDVQRQMAQAGAHLEPAMTHQPFLAPQSNGERLYSRLRFLDYRTDISLPADLVNAATCNVAYRKQVFDKIGCFDERMTSCGDFDFAWRMQTKTNLKINVVPNAIIRYQYRRDVPSMARQFRKNGWGYGLIALKYGANPYRMAPKMVVESIVLMVLSIASHLLNFCVRLLHKLFGQNSDDLYLKSPIFTMIRSVNFYYGRLIAAVKGNKWLSET